MSITSYAVLGAVKNSLIKKGYNLWGLFLQGSQNYQMDTLSSDFDFKAFVLPSFDDLYNNARISITEPTDYGLVEIKDIRLLPELIMKGNVSIVEILYTKVYWVKSHSAEFKSLREGLVANNMGNLSKSVYYTAKKKHSEMCHKTARNSGEIDAIGYEKKQLHHLARLNYVWKMLPDFEGSLIPLGKDHDLILKLKTTEMPLDEALQLANKLFGELVEPTTKPELTDEFKVYYEKLTALVKRIVYLNVSSKDAIFDKSGQYVQQIHSHYNQLPKKYKDYLEEVEPSIGKDDFVDILEYSEIELVNTWRIK